MRDGRFSFRKGHSASVVKQANTPPLEGGAARLTGSIPVGGIMKYSKKRQFKSLGERRAPAWQSNEITFGVPVVKQATKSDSNKRKLSLDKKRASLGPPLRFSLRPRFSSPPARENDSQKRKLKRGL